MGILVWRTWRFGDLKRKIGNIEVFFNELKLAAVGVVCSINELYVAVDALTELANPLSATPF